MAIPVKLEVFEGPLDLLLHLIEKNKIDIYDIPIALITDQYLEYIRAMENRDMNIMSEFLVMAATLIDIKCRMLLPKEQVEEDEDEDPRAELVRQLIEYKKYKMMGQELRDLEMDAAKSLYKGPTLPDEVKDYERPVDYEELLQDVTLSKLNQIFNEAIRRSKDKIDPIRSKFGKIEKDEINLEAKQAHIVGYIRNHKTFSFRKLLENQASKMDIIVTFLVVLELMKVGSVEIRQDELFDDIEITTVNADVSLDDISLA